MFFFFVLDQKTPVGSSLKKALTSPHLTWKQLDLLLRQSREVKPDLTIGTLQTFLFVLKRLASDEGSEVEITVKDVAEGLQAPYASIARHCDVLCKGPKGDGGLNWLTKLPGSQPKTKCLHLTSTGHMFLEAVFLHNH